MDYFRFSFLPWVWPWPLWWQLKFWWGKKKKKKGLVPSQLLYFNDWPWWYVEIVRRRRKTSPCTERSWWVNRTYALRSMNTSIKISLVLNEITCYKAYVWGKRALERRFWDPVCKKTQLQRRVNSLSKLYNAVIQSAMLFRWVSWQKKSNWKMLGLFIFHFCYFVLSL